MKPVFVTYASAGNGHRSAAQASAEALNAAGRTPVIADVLDFADPVFRKIYSDIYHMAGEHSHGVCGAMYKITDTKRETSSIVKMIDRISLSRTGPFAGFVKDNSPDSVLATHFLPMSAVAWMKRQGLYSGSLFAAVTDYDLHQMWLSEEVDTYFVANHEIEEKLCGMGIPPGRIVVSGIPVRESIAMASGKPAKQTGSSLSILFLASSIADEKALQIVDLLLSLPEKVNLDVVCGRNESLFGTLEKKLSAGNTSFSLTGFTDKIQKHYSAADVIVTKPGGLTISESLCFGLPMLFVHPIPFQETRNAEFIQRKGAGWLVSDLSSLGKMTRILASEPLLLEKTRKSCRSLARPDASRIIAHEVIRRSINPACLRPETAPPAETAETR